VKDKMFEDQDAIESESPYRGLDNTIYVGQWKNRAKSGFGI